MVESTQVERSDDEAEQTTPAPPGRHYPRRRTQLICTRKRLMSPIWAIRIAAKTGPMPGIVINRPASFEPQPHDPNDSSIPVLFAFHGYQRVQWGPRRGSGRNTGQIWHDSLPDGAIGGPGRGSGRNTGAWGSKGFGERRSGTPKRFKVGDHVAMQKGPALKQVSD